MEINKIKTKFAIGDKVYLLHNNKVVKGKILFNRNHYYCLLS